jgi:hypothetical protein
VDNFVARFFGDRPLVVLGLWHGTALLGVWHGAGLPTACAAVSVSAAIWTGVITFVPRLR